MQNITRLDNIDTVIFCTGYEPNMDMFDKDDDSNKDLFTDEPQNFALPYNWKMQEHLLTPWLGDIQPGDLNYDDYYVPPFFYDGVQISNPNFMFIEIIESPAEWPLLGHDVQAHLLAGYTCGTIELPTAEEMKRKNYERAVSAMDSAQHRSYFDVEFARYLENLTKDLQGRTCNDFLDEPDHRRELFKDYINTLFSWSLKEMEFFSQQTEQAKYPLKMFKPEGITYPLKIFSSIFPNYEDELPDGLTEQGGIFFKTLIADSLFRQITAKGKEESTFRDYVDGSNYRSLYTQTHARDSLEDLWMNLW